MNKDLTIVIPSYRSKKLVLYHLKNLKNKYKIIIVDNAHDKTLKKIIESKFKDTDVYLRKNIGFGNAINFASKFVKTKFFFVMCPDTKIYKNTISNLLKARKKIDKFGMISTTHIKDKSNKINVFNIKKKKLNVTAMFFNILLFKEFNFFY